MPKLQMESDFPIAQLLMLLLLLAPHVLVGGKPVPWWYKSIWSGGQREIRCRIWSETDWNIRWNSAANGQNSTTLQITASDPSLVRRPERIHVHARGIIIIIWMWVIECWFNEYSLHTDSDFILLLLACSQRPPFRTHVYPVAVSSTAAVAHSAEVHGFGCSFVSSVAHARRL